MRRADLRGSDGSRRERQGKSPYLLRRDDRSSRLVPVRTTRRGWDDPGDSDALVTGDTYRRRATDSLLRVTIFLCRLGGIPVLPCASGEVYAEMVHRVERLGKRKTCFFFQALESPTRSSISGFHVNL